MVQIGPAILGYFTTMAQIAATLLGLSFLALTFYLQGVFDRVKLALPVFRHEDRYRRRGLLASDRARGSGPSSAPVITSQSMLDFPDRNDVGPDEWHRQRNPFDLTDLQLFDGDPLVVFLAYSTALSWNLYFLSLLVAVTFVAWNPVPIWAIALEAFIFLLLMIYDNAVRRKQYARLRTYLTHEERLVPVLEWVILSLYGLIVLYCLWGAVGWPIPAFVAGMPIALWGLPHLFVPVLQVIVLLAFCGGLYVTNKDLFIYFKAKVSDEMRAKWLEQFGPTYQALRERVAHALDGLGESSPDLEGLRQLWNDGRPLPTYFVTPSDVPPERLWQRLTHGEGGRTIAPFMTDVPAIAAWLYDVERSVDDAARAGQRLLVP